MSIDQLRHLLDDFSDDIPTEELHGKGNFKVRRNWWQGLIGNLENGLGNGLVPENLKPEVEAFLEEYASDDFRSQPLTTQGNIEKANSLLNRLLGR